MSVVAAALMAGRQNSGDTKPTNQFKDILEQSRKEKPESFLDVLTKYGYQDQAQEIENNNVNVIKAVVSGISAEDYRILLQLIGESGNIGVVRTMEAVREALSTQSIDSADGEDGEESCH